MAHQAQQDFTLTIKNRFPQHFRNVKALDIGSLDINGNNRVLFEDSEYTGIDVGPGRNVDAVSKAHEWFVPHDHYDTIISTECFEHDMYFNLTLRNVVRMLKPGGLFVFTCATTGRGEHGTRNSDTGSSPLTCSIEGWADYYKNIVEDDVRSAIDVDKVFGEYEFTTHCGDLYFWGIVREYPENTEKPEIILCIPTLCRYDLIEKCIDSALSGIDAPDRIVVIDNGGGYVPSNPMVEVIKPESPKSVSASWNYFMDHYYGVKIIANDDIEFKHDTIGNLAAALYEYPEIPIFFIKDYGFTCFLLRDSAYKEIGRFDENFVPAYYEDNDYIHRVKIAGRQYMEVHGEPLVHHGSSTISSFSPEDKQKHSDSFRNNTLYYAKKWGGIPGNETITQIYDRDILPLK